MPGRLTEDSVRFQRTVRLNEAATVQTAVARIEWQLDIKMDVVVLLHTKKAEDPVYSTGQALELQLINV